MTKRQWSQPDIKQAFFPVELRPLFMESQNDLMGWQQLPRHFAVVDTEREHAFSVVTNDYRLITNKEAYEKSADIIKSVFQATSLDELECFNIQMPSTRSFCHIDLIHKASEFSPWEKDRWSAFLRITNSYNRTHRLRFELGFCRWICLNGLIFGQKSIEFSFAHTSRGVDRIDRYHDNIGDIHKLESDMQGKLKGLQRFYVPSDFMLPLACKVFGVNVGDETLRQPQRLKLLVQFKDRIQRLTEDYFEELGPHGYAALNVLTDYASYPEGVISPDSQINSFQARCGGWMEEFLDQIQQADFSFEQYLSETQETARILEAI